MPWQLPGHTLPAIAAASIVSWLLPHLPSQFQSRPGCWPASKRGNSTYPFAKALEAANDSGNVPGKNTNTDTETAPYMIHQNLHPMVLAAGCRNNY